MEMRHSSNTHHCDIEKNSNDKGFVLVSVIWIAGLLAVLATAFRISVRSHILAGRNIVQGERARYLADGMVEFMALFGITRSISFGLILLITCTL